MSFANIVGQIGSAVGSTVQAFGGLGGIGRAFGIKELARLDAPAPPPANVSRSTGFVAGTTGGSAFGGGGAGGEGAGGAGGGNGNAGAVMNPDAGVYFRAPAGTTARLEAIPQHPRFDILTMGQSDDREFAKLLYTRGFIVADSDMGQVLRARGHKPQRKRVTLSDGRRITIEVFSVSGKRTGGRKQKNYFTPAKIRDASYTLKDGLRAIRTLDKLTKASRIVDRKLNPKPRVVSASRTTTRRTTRKR